MSCPICEKRKAERFCPAKGEKICAICCGTYREVTIDCPADCSHLIAAHRYEDGHQRALPADTPLLDEKIPPDMVHTLGGPRVPALLGHVAHEEAGDEQHEHHGE